MNQIASPCCGSCKYFSYNKTVGRNCCNYKRAIMLYLTSFPERICAVNYYKPRNPISIIDLPGVKKLIEAAYIAGLTDAAEQESEVIYASITIGDMAVKYMKALVAKDE